MDLRDLLLPRFSGPSQERPPNDSRQSRSSRKTLERQQNVQGHREVTRTTLESPGTKRPAHIESMVIPRQPRPFHGLPLALAVALALAPLLMLVRLASPSACRGARGASRLTHQSTSANLHIIAKRVAERVECYQVHRAAREGPHQRERCKKTSSRDLGQLEGCPLLRPPASEVEGSQRECLATFVEVRR